MTGRRTWLFVCLLIAALPLAAHERKVILVMVDTEANRAYIPEGTVLPPGMNVRVEKTSLDRETFETLRAGALGRDRAASRQARVTNRAMRSRLEAKPPLVFEYAPVERFAAMRKNYEARVASRRSPVQTDSHQTCFDTYVQDVKEGVYHEYYAAFTSTFCQPSAGLVVGQPNDWEFRAEGEHSDDDQWITPYVYVDDDNGNFTCFDEWEFSGDTGQCSASASTVLWQQGCLNDVDTGSLQYAIEYLEGYVENYIAFGFLVDYCTYFY